MLDLTLDLRNLRYAILAAELGSFRRAAAELGIHQSTLSRRVQLLEDRLGVPIFERNAGGVRVTSAGEAFLREAAIGADHFHRAVQALTSVKNGNSGELRIGIVSLAAGFLGDVVEEYRALFEHVELRFEERTAQANLGRLVKGDLDVVFVAGTPVVPGCDTLRLWHERIFVALPLEHGLAGRDELTWDDIRRERFIVSTDGPGPEIHDCLISRLSALGFRPDIRRHRVSRENLMTMVARGFGLTVTTESTLGVAFAGLAFRPIAGDTEIVPCSAVWSTNNGNPALKRFLAIAKAASRRAGFLGVDEGANGFQSA